MGFDKNDSRPIIQPAKKTTQVNLLMVGTVLIFLLLGAGAIIWMSVRHGPN